MSFDPTSIFVFLGFLLGMVLLIDLLNQLKKKASSKLRIGAISFLCLSSFVISTWSIVMTFDQLNLNTKCGTITTHVIRNILSDKNNRPIEYDKMCTTSYEGNNIWVYVSMLFAISLLIFLFTIIKSDTRKYIKFFYFILLCCCIFITCVETWIIAKDLTARHYNKNYGFVINILSSAIRRSLQEKPEETKRLLEGQLYLVCKHSDYYLLGVNKILCSLPIQGKPITQDDIDTKLCTGTNLANWIFIFLVIIYFILCWLQDKENRSSTKEMILCEEN